ncbi:MAG: T9SS type A sorting domain-containing protein [Bacteroidales bacterium]|nr:T9SS type A sorting domain-containing protein [Bacteroidales bacterium]
MKKIIITMLCLTSATCAFGQHAYSYSYDQAGNRTYRQRINYAMANASPQDTCLLSSPAIAMAYPNPTEGDVSIEFDGSLEIDRLVHVYDSQGKMLLEGTTSEPLIQLNLRDFPSGIYLIEAIEKGKRTIWKISKR